MNEKTRDKLTTLQQLLREKEAIEKKIEAILSPEKGTLIPPDFSLNNEVLALTRGAESGGILAASILTILQKKFPDYSIDRKKVANSLAYLKNTKKLVMQSGRGAYKSIS
jgi:hypothetical protein